MGAQLSLKKGGTPPNFRPVSIVAKRSPISATCFVFIMAILHSRCGHYIFVLWFMYLLSAFYLFFLTESQLSQIGCLPYFHTWCCLSANVWCRSETCCTWLAV